MGQRLNSHLVLFNQDRSQYCVRLVALYLSPLGCSCVCSFSAARYFFKVANLTFWFNLPSSNRAERQRSEARDIQPNLTHYNQAPCRLRRLVKVACASLSLRSAVANPDTAYFSAALNRPPRSKRHQAWRPFN